MNPSCKDVVRTRIMTQIQMLQKSLDEFCLQTDVDGTTWQDLQLSSLMSIDNESSFEVSNGGTNVLLMSLPPEVVATIVDNLHQTDVLSLCLVNKAMYLIAIKKLFKCIYVNSPDKKVLPYGLCSFYREFTVVNYKSFLRLSKFPLPKFINKIMFLYPKFSQNFIDQLHQCLPLTQLYIIQEICRPVNLINPSCISHLQVPIEILPQAMNSMPSTVKLLEIYGEGNLETLDFLGQYGDKLDGITKLSLFNFKWTKRPKKTQHVVKLKLRVLEIIGDFNSELICDLFDILTIEKFLLSCKHSRCNTPPITALCPQLTSLTHLSLGGPVPVNDILRELPENTVQHLKLDLFTKITTCNLDFLLERHNRSIKTISIKMGEKFNNGTWQMGPEMGETNSDAQAMVNELNKVPDKYRQLKFASIYNNHFEIDRSFGDFIEAQRIETTESPQSYSRRSSVISVFEESWIK
jgi:hypothetical protein